MMLATDVSHTTWGVTFENQSTIVEWSMEERKQSINWLERKTVLLGLKTVFSPHVEGM